MKRLGLVLLFLVVAVVIGYRYLGRSLPGAPQFASTAGGGTTVRGPIGGEKAGLLKDPEVAGVLRSRFGLTVDYSRAGSIEMVRGDTTGQDFLWPSSQIALELYKQKGGKPRQAEIVFNSPLVLYTRRMVTDALIKNEIVRKEGETYYLTGFPKLVRMVNAGKTWKDLGLPQLYGKIRIVSTDPTRSNSGNMFAGLLANMMNQGEVVNASSLSKVMPPVKQFFDRQGYQLESSGDLFTQFLQQGVGSFPIIVGYESQLVEFSLENPQYRDVLRKEIDGLYPRPTVWSSHPMIALTPNGERLLKAVQDPEIQKMAWERHGFRSGMIGVQNDPKVLQVARVPATVENVIPLPTPQVMDSIIHKLSHNGSGSHP